MGHPPLADRRKRPGEKSGGLPAAVVAYRKGAAVRLTDVATVTDSVQDLRNAGLADGKPAVLIQVRRQPGANVNRDRRSREGDPARCCRPLIPSSINLQIATDSTTTIRASLREVERTLLIAISLVIMVVFLFLRRWRAGARSRRCGARLAHRHLRHHVSCRVQPGQPLAHGPTIATGFVVDDAVVVLENVSRHIEAGVSPYQAALLGAREVGFTVVFR